MKKLFLLSAAGLLSLGAGAQQATQNVVRTGLEAAAVMKAPLMPVAASTRSAVKLAKTTATPFWSEDFGSGAAGWTVTNAGPTGSGWRYTKQAAAGTYNIGTLNSTTASNGWMIFDSDSLGDINPTAKPLTAALESPVFSCAGHNTVMVSFQQYFRKFYDSCFVDVKIGSGAWNVFPLKDNNGLNNTSALKGGNPTTSRVDISTLAANQSAVQIRFRYVLSAANVSGGAYNWLVDDVAVSELENVDLGIATSAAYLFNGQSSTATILWPYGLFGSIPTSLADSVVPVTYISNYGKNAITTPGLTFKLFNGTNLVTTQPGTYPTVPYQALDSVADWDGYRLSANGSYTAAFDISAPSDAFLANNVDTQRFNVVDSSYINHGSQIIGTYSLHRPAGSSGPELSLQYGVRFDIPAGKKDTVTSVSVSFGSTTSVGVNTVVQIYKITGTSPNVNWTAVARTRTKTLTSGDISTSAGAVLTNYYCNITNSTFPLYILDEGHYAAIVKTLGASPTQIATVNATNPMFSRTDIAGFYGQADTAFNDSDPNNFDFSNVGIATGLGDACPLVRVNFGHYPKASAVANIHGVNIGDAYPNPANSTINVPVSVTETAEIKVSLTNAVGQVVATKDLGRLSAGQQKVAQFNTSGFAAGVYTYTVEANGSRVSNRVVVAH